jgi:hypothetical protein
MTNIRQTDLLKYIVDKFNTNSFGIPFRMGTYGTNVDNTGLVINIPVINNDGHFDTFDTFNDETYAITKNSFVAMQGMATNGEYTPLPNVQLVAYDIPLEFLVYIDNPISEIIRMAIEEIRDSFIGNLDILEIEEVDLEDETEGASTIVDYLKITTTSDSLDFGEIFTINKRRYLNYTLTVTLTVSKNVEMGNQFEWTIQQLAQNTWVLSDVNYWNTNGTVGSVFDLSQLGLTSPNPSLLPSATFSPIGKASRIAYRPSPSETFYAYYKNTPVAYTGTLETVVPLAVSWGTTQDMESFQTLQSLNPVRISKAKQVHNYVKSRGYGLTMTFLFDSSVSILRRFFKDTFEEVETPFIYNIGMKFKEVDANGDLVYSNDLLFTKRVVFGEAQPSEISYGEPVVVSVGFVISSK